METGMRPISEAEARQLQPVSSRPSRIGTHKDIVLEMAREIRSYPAGTLIRIVVAEQDVTRNAVKYRIKTAGQIAQRGIRFRRSSKEYCLFVVL